MTDLIERMKQVLKSSDQLEALQLLPEAIREIEELRATIKERLREIAAMGQGEEQDAAIMGVMIDLVKKLSRFTKP